MIVTHTQQGRRAAFTLVELLVVIGLMAVLATISVAGYSAASRGMADRGTIQTTASILRVAQQTCQIDRVPTKVMFFNQKLSDDQNLDEATLYQGTAIAIKQAGRITLKPSTVKGLLVDEFADWNQSYPTMEEGVDSSGPGMRIFRMTHDDLGKDIDSCSVLVQPAVTYYQLDDYMIHAGARMKDWCVRHGRTANDNHSSKSSVTVDNGNNYVWGFKASKSGNGGGLSVDSWKVGDPYGIEIARVDLPKGYIFGNSPPSGYKLKSAGTVSFKVPNASSEGLPVQISAMRPAGGGGLKAKDVGAVSSKMLDDK